MESCIKVGMTDTTLLMPEALDLVTTEVEANGEAEWAAPSPCEGWTSLEVLNHVTGTVAGTMALLAGGVQSSSPAEAGGATSVEEVVTLWFGSAGRVTDLILTSDPARPVGGEGGETLAEALAFPVADIAIHAWDLAAAAGRECEFSDALLEFVDGLLRSVPEDRLRAEGVFGPAVEAPEGATRTEQLMAFAGRTRP